MSSCICSSAAMMVCGGSCSKVSEVRYNTLINIRNYKNLCEEHESGTSYLQVWGSSSYQKCWCIISTLFWIICQQSWQARAGNFENFTVSFYGLNDHHVHLQVVYCNIMRIRMPIQNVLIKLWWFKSLQNDPTAGENKKKNPLHNSCTACNAPQTDPHVKQSTILSASVPWKEPNLGS